MRKLGRVVWGLVVLGGVVVMGCGKSTRKPGTDELGQAGADHGEGGGATAEGGGAAAAAGEGGASGWVPESCNVPTAKLLEWRVFGPHAQRFTGPVLVERSTDGDLLLAFDLSEDGNSAGAHLKLTGVSPMPRLSLGKRLWLEYDAPTANSGDFGPPSARSLRVYDEEGGTLLLGRSFTNSYNVSTAAAPLEVFETVGRCTEQNDSCESDQAVHEWEAVGVVADTNTLLEPGVSTPLELDGVAYDAVGLAFGETDGGGACAADYRAFNVINVSVVARDPEAVTSKAPLEDLPACSVYNDVESSAGFSLLGVGIGTDYSGPAVYQGVQLREGLTVYDFATPELMAQFPDSPPSLELTDWAKDFAPPAEGTTLYFESHGYEAGALFSEQGGAPLFVAALQLGPFDQSMLSTLSRWLGVPVELQKTCDYTGSLAYPKEPPLALWQLAFGSDPPITVHTGERAQLTLGGKKYQAYVGGLEAMSLILWAF